MTNRDTISDLLEENQNLREILALKTKVLEMQMSRVDKLLQELRNPPSPWVKAENYLPEPQQLVLVKRGVHIHLGWLLIKRGELGYRDQWAIYNIEKKYDNVDVNLNNDRWMIIPD